MKRLCLITVLYTLFGISMSAQKIAKFELIMPDTIIENSLYNRIECLNELCDRHDFGFIIKSILGTKTPIVSEVPISVQLDTLIERVTDATAGDKTLFLQLRDINFSNIGAGKCLCHIRFNLYEKDDTIYKFINMLDTTVYNNTNNIINETSYSITDFIIQNLNNEPVKGLPYSFNDLLDIDIIEKENTPLYQHSDYKNGVYYSFHSFANQQPDITKMQVITKKDVIKNIEIFDETKGKWVKVKSDNIYAVIINNKIYVVDDKKYYPVYSNENNLMFVALKSSGSFILPSGGLTFSAGRNGNSLGGGISFTLGSKSKDKVLYMIDHINGSFIFKDMLH